MAALAVAALATPPQQEPEKAVRAMPEVVEFITAKRAVVVAKEVLEALQLAAEQEAVAKKT